MLDLISTIDNDLNALGCPANTLAGLSGVSSGVLSGYLNGSRVATPDHQEKIRRAMSGLKKLVEAAKPLPIDFRQVGLLRELIDQLESGELHIQILKSEPVAPTEEFNVFLRSGQYFVERKFDSIGQLKVFTTTQCGQGGRFSRSVADQVVEALAEIGFVGQVIRSRFTSQDGPSLFDSVWQTLDVKEVRP